MNLHQSNPFRSCETGDIAEAHLIISKLPLLEKAAMQNFIENCKHEAWRDGASFGARSMAHEVKKVANRL